MTAAPSGATVLTGSLRGGTATSLAADDDGYFQINSTTSGTRTSAFQGSFTGVSNDLGGLKVTYKGKNSKSTTQTVAIWNWATNAGSSSTHGPWERMRCWSRSHRPARWRTT